jgi:AcrR family transcriptional regulator/DNA-binding MarR family transcriptional regulator
VLRAGGARGVHASGAGVGAVLSRRGDVLVSQAQRARMLSSAVAVISRVGYGEMSIARITTDAGVSRRTFYDIFEDREDCFLAAFDEAVARARVLMLTAYEQKRGWRERTRAALLALLALLDDEPGVARLLVVDALKAGPRIQQRRAAILKEVSRALHEQGSSERTGRELPALTGEGVVGAVLTVVHTRLLENGKSPLVELTNELMGLIVLPYLGVTAASRELQVPATPTPPARSKAAHRETAGESLVGLPIRITYRTILVLNVIAKHPGASNRRIADEGGIADQGQISRLLTRLQNLGLIENAAPGQPSGEPNEWRLTSRGEQVSQALHAAPDPDQASSDRQAG